MKQTPNGGDTLKSVELLTWAQQLQAKFDSSLSSISLPKKELETVHYSLAPPWVSNLSIDPASVTLSSRQLWTHAAHGSDTFSKVRESLKSSLYFFIEKNVSHLPGRFLIYKYTGCPQKFHRDALIICPNESSSPHSLIVVKGGSETQRYGHSKTLQSALHIARQKWPNLKGTLLRLGEKEEKGSPLVSLAELKEILTSSNPHGGDIECHLVNREEVLDFAIQERIMSPAEAAFERAIRLRHAKHSRALDPGIP